MNKLSSGILPEAVAFELAKAKRDKMKTKEELANEHRFKTEVCQQCQDCPSCIERAYLAGWEAAMEEEYGPSSEPPKSFLPTSFDHLDREDFERALKKYSKKLQDNVLKGWIK